MQDVRFGPGPSYYRPSSLTLNSAAVVENTIREVDGKFFVFSEDPYRVLGGPFDTRGAAEARLRQIEFFKNNSLSSITFNLDAPRIRQDTLEGRPHIVVPMIMLVEGVHNGSGGPLLYPAEELRKTPEVWNYKPIVVYHPEINGVGVSACDKTILESRKIGVILNAHYRGAKLHAEAWLEEARVKAVDERILNALQKQQMVELSTGLFTDNEWMEGSFNGEPYIAVARNYRPDHLAILPDKKGACSIEDGAGLLRLNQDVLCENCKKTINKENVMDKEKFIAELIKNSDWTDEDKEFLMGLTEAQLTKMAPKTPEPTKNDDGKKKVEPSPAPIANVEPKNEDPKPEPKKAVTLNDYISNAPPELQEMLVSGLKAHEKEKQELITVITANENNLFTPEALARKTLDELQGIAALAKKPAVQSASPALPSFAGLAGAPQTNETKVKPLGLPTMSFESK